MDSLAWFRNISLVGKILIFTALTLTALAVTTFVGARQIARLSSALEELDTLRIPSVHYAAGMQSALADYRIYEYRHILSTEPAQMSSVEAILATERARFIANEQAYNLLYADPEERRLYTAFKQFEERYLEVHERILKLSRVNNIPEAFGLIRGESKVMYDSCSSYLQAILRLNIKAANTARQVSHVVVARALSTYITFGVVFVLLVLVLFRVIHHTVTVPIELLAEAMRHGAAGNPHQLVSTSVSVSTSMSTSMSTPPSLTPDFKDEIGSLVLSYNSMIQQLTSEREETQAQHQEILRQQRIMQVQTDYTARANASLRQNNSDLRQFMQREFLRIEELARHKDALVEVSKQTCLHDGDVRQAFQRITETGVEQLSVARLGIWLIHRQNFIGEPQTEKLHLQDLFVQESGEHLSGDVLLSSDYPAYMAALQNNDHLSAPDAMNDERTRELAEPYLAKLGIGALLDVPVRVGSAFTGVLCAEHVGGVRNWTLEEQMFLQCLSSFVTIALDASEKSRQRELLAELNGEIMLVNTELQTRVMELAHAQAVREQTLQHINQQNELLESKTTALAASNAELQQKTGQLSEINTALADAYQTMRRQNNLLQDKTAQESLKLVDLQDRNEQMDKTYSELSSAYDEIRDQNERLEQQARQAAIMTNELHDKNALLQHTNTELASTYREIRRQNDLLQEQTMLIEQANAQLQEKNIALMALNNEKNDLLGIVAHDLRNPLASIMLGAAFVRRSIEKTGELSVEHAIRSINRIEDTAERMNTIIAEMLDLNAIESGNMRIAQVDLNLNALANIITDDFTKRAEEKNIVLHLRLPDDEIRAQTDGRMMRQILDNILSNAIKYSPPGKSVFVILERHDAGEKPAARFIIRDQGPGINEKDRALLFQKFTRLSAKPTAGEHSTGLGLSIVKRFVEALGGSVWCESSPESGRIGADFIVQIPLSPEFPATEYTPMQE
jgi:signal transduction histidine kinase/HAMP domain-containing protein